MILQYKGFNENWIYEEAERVGVATVGFDPMWKKIFQGQNLISLGKERKDLERQRAEVSQALLNNRSSMRTANAQTSNEEVSSVKCWELKNNITKLQKNYEKFCSQIEILDELEDAKRIICDEDSELDTLATIENFIRKVIEIETACENITFIGIADLLEVDNFTVVSLTGKDKNITYVFDKSKSGVYLLNDSGKTIQRL